MGVLGSSQKPIDQHWSHRSAGRAAASSPPPPAAAGGGQLRPVDAALPSFPVRPPSRASHRQVQQRAALRGGLPQQG